MAEKQKIMAEVCKFPACKRVAEKNGYCVGHRIYAPKSSNEKEVKYPGARQQPIKKKVKSE